MSTINTSNKTVFYDPAQVPNTITSKLIQYRALPLSSDQEWKKPFIMDNNLISVERIQAALIHGPFVAEAKLGPKFYNGEPTKFDKGIQTHPDLPVYGWLPAQRKERGDASYQEIIVCGVQKIADKEHVFYLLAEEMQTDWISGITQHKKTANKVHVSSVQKFSDSLYNMYPPAENKETERAQLSAEERSAILQRNIATLISQINQKRATQQNPNQDTV